MKSKLLKLALALGVFVCISKYVKKKKEDSIFINEQEQRNPMEGCKIEFVPDEKDEENADGQRGHLEKTGNSDYHPIFYDKYVKRGLDIALSFGGLLVLSPVLLGIAAAVYIDDPGPVLFTQKRIGKNKQYFKLHKFRSMKMCTPHDVPTHMLENPEQYITRVGRFLRAHSLDELPQIWDIFIGNMSIIGPRPALWNQDNLTAEREKYGANNVKPGLTGWAQINGRDELEIVDKAKLDGEYVRNESFLFDAKCFLGTVSKIGHDDSVVEGGTGEMKKTQIRELRRSVRRAEILGKKILLFSPAFFGYEIKIKEKMEEMGAEVDLYDERSVTKPLDRAILKVFPRIFEKQSNKYYNTILQNNADKDYDYILLVKCDMTPKQILLKMKQLYPKAKLCLYLWDSFKNILGIEEKLDCFDIIHSFDPKDCVSREDFFFRPLFYSDDFCKRKWISKNENLVETSINDWNSDGLKLQVEENYDLCFAGTIHSDRYAIIKEIEMASNQMGLKSFWFKYLQDKKIYYFYKTFKKEFRKTNLEDFSYEKLESVLISDIERRSNVILDIQHPKQTGLTMRTIEMLGMGKKIITTNAQIKEYDFYDPNNILVINRQNPKIAKEFFELEYKEIEESIYQSYSLENWILEILSE